MHRTALLAIVLLLAAAVVPIAADTGVGYSNVFSIDNAAGDTRICPPAAKYVNPYVTVSDHTIRGQIHCHRCQDKLPGQPWWVPQLCTTGPGLAQIYRNMGYGFVAATGHDEVSTENTPDNWQGWAPHSCEVTHTSIVPTDPHVLALGTNASSFDDLSTGAHWYDPMVVRLATIVQNIRNHAGLAFIAHPDSRPYNISPDDLYTVYWNSPFDGIAVFNSNAFALGPIGGNNYENTWDRWISRNRWAVRTGQWAGLWGFGEDDYHYAGWNCANGTRNRAWIGVPGDFGEWWGSIKEKLRNGDFYAYWVENGPWTGTEAPADLRVTTAGTPYPTITATVTKNGAPCAATIKFRTKYGWNSGVDQGVGSRSYQCSGNEGYVRVKAFVVQGYNELCIASQPIIIYGSGNQGGSQSLVTTKSLGATSSDLHLRYLELDELPSTMPKSGCIGHAFEVTTDTGQVAPATTLQLSFDGEDTSALGGTMYLAIYRYDDSTSAWVKLGGTVDPVAATVETPITALGKYCVSADLPPDTTAPEVFLDNPPSGGVVNMNTTVNATVNDDLGAWRVSFYLNDHPVKEDADAIDFWTADIALADYCEGDYTLKAVAEDLAGNTGATEIPIHIHSSTALPTVTIASPTSGATLSGTVTATGTCGDNVSVASVALKIGGTPVGFAAIDGSNWTAEIDTSYLVNGQRTLAAIVEDYPGNQAAASVNVTVANGGTASAIGSLKSIADGETARFSGAIVVAGTDLVGGSFYAESLDRSSGIRVLTDRTVNAGDMISVSGVMATIGTERAVEAYDVLIASSGNTLPNPIGVLGKALLQNPGSIGKIVRCWGAVKSVDPSSQPRWFVIDDGSGVTLKCSVPVGVEVPTTGFVTVTGVCSVDAQTGQAVILVASSGGMQTLSQ